MPQLLVIDDDRSVLRMVQAALKDANAEVLAANEAAKALEILGSQQPDAILLDIMLPEISGLELFPKIQALAPKTPIIFITSGGASEVAIQAMRLGAHDFLLKPLELPQVHDKVLEMFEISRLMRQPVKIPGETLGGQSPDNDDAGHLVGSSAAMMEVYKNVGRVANEDVTVLIHGESGTGKELVARAIYHYSQRAGKPFLAVNCAALPENLLESELFGHEKGAFTGADQQRKGKFEQCDGGVIFLDEIGDMPPVLQAKMLRVLQEQEFERVGGNNLVKVDVRVIAATHRDLEQMVEDESFRADLFYRLNGFTIELPPLRARGDDVDLLIHYFLRQLGKQLGAGSLRLSPEAEELLKRHKWPGNVRELRAVLKQSAIQSNGPLITQDNLPESVQEQAPGGKAAAAGDAFEEFLRQRIDCETSDLYAECVEWLEKRLLPVVLQHTEGNQTQAAEMLGITRGSLRNKLRMWNISLEQVVKVDKSDE